MYRKILVPIDGSPTSLRGLDEAVKLAQTTGGTLRLVHVLDDMPQAMYIEGYGALHNDLREVLRSRAEELLAAALARIEKSGVTVETALLDGAGSRLADLLADQADKWGADVIVLGTHGRRGVSRLLIGSDAEQVLRTATVPVLLVRAQDAASASLAQGRTASKPARPVSA